MSKKIGIDFGTTNTVVSYWDGNDLRAFEYNGSFSVPTLIAYSDKNKYKIGRAALSQTANENVDFIQKVKMYLPLSLEKKKINGWTSERQAEDIINDFFISLLKKGKVDNFEDVVGQIEEVVLCVPHVWSHQPDHLGRNKLLSIFKDKHKIKVKRVVSEPVAAAAYFVYYMKKVHNETFKGNVLVCDMGGGTFDATLCKVNESGKIEVINNAGNGTTELGIGRSGEYFDRELIKTVFGDDLARTEYLEIYKALQDVKKDDSSDIKENAELACQETNEKNKNKTVIFYLKGAKVTYENIMKAFKDVERHTIEVLKQITENQNLKIDKVFITGGFNQFYFCQKIIRDFFGNKKSLFYDAKVDTSIAGKSISFGAALIANDMVSIDEKFPSTVGFISKRLNPQLTPNSPNTFYIKEDNNLLIGGKILSEYFKPVWTEDVYRAGNANNELLFNFYIDPYNNKNKRIDFPLKIVDLPKQNGNQWYVGFKLDENQTLYILFKNKDNDKLIKEYSVLSLIEHLNDNEIVKI